LESIQKLLIKGRGVVKGRPSIDIVKQYLASLVL